MKKSIPFRAWFYFRTGYSQYFSFILAVANMFTITYYLAIEKNHTLEFIFPSFSSYIMISSIMGIPLLVLAGFLHMRRSRAFASEAEILTESNPYNYKLIPGIQKDVFVPLLLQLLVLTRRSFSSEKLNIDEIDKLKKLSEKLDHLTKGGMLEIPKKLDDL
jgi:hypothetical protein